MKTSFRSSPGESSAALLWFWHVGQGLWGVDATSQLGPGSQKEEIYIARKIDQKESRSLSHASQSSVEVGHKYLSKNGRGSAQVLWGVNAVLPSSQGRERGSKLARRKVSKACVVHLFLSWTSEEHCVIFTTEDIACSHA